MKIRKKRVIAYKQGSKGAKTLSAALNGVIVKRTGSIFKPHHGDKVINWGKSDDLPDSCDGILDDPAVRVFNRPEAVRRVSNKLHFFNDMKEKCPEVIPPFWTNKDEIPAEAYPIVCRTVLSGHSGAGIHMADQPSDLCPAPLYVSYIKKKDEYRVHLGKRVSEVVVIGTQRKAVPEGTTPATWQIRNHSNGFIFVRQGVNPPKAVLDAAIAAFKGSNLDFGAVDMIYNDKKEKAYVLEINTAPGLEGQTVADYAAFFRSL